MNGSASNAHTIFVGVDGSPSGEQAVLWAADEARRQHRGLTVVHAEKPFTLHQQAWLSSAGVSLRELTDQLRDDAEQILEHARAVASDRLADSSQIEVETLFEVGDPRSVLLELSLRAPLVVVGSRGHSRVVGLLLGSVSGALIRHAHGPVAVVRPAVEGRRGVLVGADGSEASRAPLEVAYAEAASRGVRLTVLHCLWDAWIGRAGWSHLDSSDPDIQEARLRVSESLAGMTEKYPDVPVHVSVARGAVDACLVDLSRQHELLVLGRPPRSLGERLVLPGVSASVAEHAHAPVIVVP